MVIDYEPHKKAQCHLMGDTESYFRNTSPWPNQDRENLKTNQGYINSMYREVEVWLTLGTKTPKLLKNCCIVAGPSIRWAAQGKPLDLAQRKTVRLEIIAGGFFPEVEVLDKGQRYI